MVPPLARANWLATRGYLIGADKRGCHSTPHLDLGRTISTLTQSTTYLRLEGTASLTIRLVDRIFVMSSKNIEQASRGARSRKREGQKNKKKQVEPRLELGTFSALNDIKCERDVITTTPFDLSVRWIDERVLWYMRHFSVVDEQTFGDIWRDSGEPLRWTSANRCKSARLIGPPARPLSFARSNSIC